MKKLFTIMMALVMMLTLSQCKKQNEENEDNTAKVRISCTIPLNKDGKTDFTSDGTVNWSAEPERIYLAIPATDEITQQLVVLTSETNAGGSTLTFRGNVNAGSLDITGKTKYDVWYLGRSQDSKLAEGSVTGSIANQSGNLEDLGYHHIAKATVTASVGDDITLTFNGTFKNQIAIIKLGDESASTNILRGNAIIGTDYSLQYDENENKFELAVTESANAKISVVPQAEGESYVVVFPNEETNVELKSDSGKKVTFLNGINAGSMYTVGWEEYEGNNGYEYVDLGLPSGLKWATFNVGANTPEEYGDYFAWGEIETKDEYTLNNSITWNKEISNISGNTTYDAATVNWGEDWRIPTQGEMKELIDNCTWTRTQLNGVNGYNVTGTNGKSIFLPAAGYYRESYYTEQIGNYWTSSPGTDNQKAHNLVFGITNSGNTTYGIGNNDRNCGRTIRPVSGRKFDIGEVTTAEVTSITDNSAVCGGYVTGNNAYVTEKGICWSTSENPTIDDPNDNKMVCGQGEGEYTVTLTGLTSATVYYVRAYAKNEAGISYGSQVRFNTTMTGSNGYAYDFSNMGSHAVDLGLPSGVMWSDCNIGAEWAIDKVKNEGVWTENIYGNYFMWACVNSSQYFGEEYYPDYAKACNSNYDYSYNYSGDIRYDAATYNFGGNWRTPTTKDFFELRDNCDWEYVEIEKDGIEIYCVKYTNKKDRTKFIYFPLGGYYDSDSELTWRTDTGCFLISELETHTGCRYIGLCNYIVECRWFANFRWCGYNVRPVIGPIPQ